VFRFYEVEYALACGMDGERDVAGIVKWAQDELGLTPSHNEVRTVISTLNDLGFIEAATELAAGVVAALPERAQPAPSVELGAAGASGPRPAPLPPAPSFELGAVGTAARSQRPTPSPPGGVVLGAPGTRSQRPTPSAPHSTSDVSLDLSEHISVRPDDVKEAVRASKVMAAVDVPADMMEVITDRPTAPASAFDAPTVARIPEVEALAETTRSPDMGRGRSPEYPGDIRIGKSPPGRQPASSRPPVELPPPPAQTERVRPPPVQRSGVSPVLIVALVVAVLGAGVFLAWKYMLDKPAPDADTPAVAPPAFKPPPPPPPPPAPTAKIVLETPDPEEVKVTRAGVIETIVADQARVKEGDIVLRLVGDKPIEAEISGLMRDQKRLKDQIDAATKKRDAAQHAGNRGAEANAQNEIADREKSLANKQNLLATKTADLDGFLVHAPAAGTFTPLVKLSQKITADAVIGKLQRDPIPTATFKVDTKAYAANASVEVTVGKGEEQRVTCTVADVQPDSVKLHCPGDAALNQGTDVALQAPSATSQAVPEPPAPTPAPSPGSAAAPAGSAAAPSEPAGSAAPAAPTAPAETPPMPGNAPAPSGSAAEPAGGSAAPAAPPAPSGSAADKPG
jgi:hypothetical protein